MRKVFSIIIVITSAVISISAQTKLERRHHSEVINTASKTDTSVSEVGNGAFYRTSYNYPLEDFKPGVVRVGPRTTYLKDGLRIDEVIRLLGKPLSITERIEQNASLKVYIFQRSEGQVLIAEFENGLLVRSYRELRETQPAQADR